MLDWDKIKTFYNVVRGGSFRGSVSRIGVGQSAISRQISGLEQRLGSPLFYRNTGGLRLTPQGKMLFRTAHEVFTELTMVEARLKNAARPTQTPLNIASSVGFGTSWLIPHLNQFATAYPDVCLTIHLSDDTVDLSTRESDVAITTDIPEDDSLVHQWLLSRPLNLYADQEYLSTFGTPQSLDDLDTHRLVVFEGKDRVPFNNASWLLTCGTSPGLKRSPFLTFNNLHAVAGAVAGGAGIGCLPAYLADAHPNLVQILPKADVPVVHFYFVYPRQLQDLKIIHTLRDFLEEEAKG